VQVPIGYGRAAAAPAALQRRGRPRARGLAGICRPSAASGVYTALKGRRSLDRALSCCGPSPRIAWVVQDGTSSRLRPEFGGASCPGGWELSCLSSALRCGVDRTVVFGGGYSMLQSKALGSDARLVRPSSRSSAAPWNSAGITRCGLLAPEALRRGVGRPRRPHLSRGLQRPHRRRTLDVWKLSPVTACAGAAHRGHALQLVSEDPILGR